MKQFKIVPISGQEILATKANADNAGMLFLQACIEGKIDNTDEREGWEFHSIVALPITEVDGLHSEKIERRFVLYTRDADERESEQTSECMAPVKEEKPVVEKKEEIKEEKKTAPVATTQQDSASENLQKYWKRDDITSEKKEKQPAKKETKTAPVKETKTVKKSQEKPVKTQKKEKDFWHGVGGFFANIFGFIVNLTKEKHTPQKKKKKSSFSKAKKPVKVDEKAKKTVRKEQTTVKPEVKKPQEKPKTETKQKVSTATPVHTEKPAFETKNDAESRIMTAQEQATENLKKYWQRDREDGMDYNKKVRKSTWKKPQEAKTEEKKEQEPVTTPEAQSETESRAMTPQEQATENLKKYWQRDRTDGMEYNKKVRKSLWKKK